MPGTVLVVEDDPKTAELVRLYLFRDGYKTLVAADGLTGLRLARESHPDLVVLDLMLPGMDGLEVCRTLRQESEIPIIMLTARVEEQDRLAGLDLGADDYITKPFSPRELRARVKAALRRAGSESPDVFRFGNTEVDFARCEVRRGSDTIDLSALEFKLLTAFVRSRGRVLTREQLLDAAWGRDVSLNDRVVDNHIVSLRRKIEPDPERPQFLVNIRGLGYRFDA